MSKKPYALLMNDIHVSKDNISEFQKNWDEALSICRERDIPEIIIGGDLWMSRSAQTLPVLMAVRDALLKATAGKEGIFVTIACGNHDKIDQETLESYNHVFNEYTKVEVVDDFIIRDMSDSADLYVMSYFPENGTFIERLNELKKEMVKDKRSVLYIHEGIRGGISKPSDDELPADIFAEFDSVLVGHYHDRKQVCGTNILYIGASRQHNYGEDEEKGYTVLYEDGSFEFIQNNVNARYVTMLVPLEGVTDPDLEKKLSYYHKDGHPNYSIRFVIRCKASEVGNVDRQKLMGLGVGRIEFLTEESMSVSNKSQGISVKFDKSGIKDEYKNFCHEKHIDNIEFGLKYLNKIN